MAGTASLRFACGVRMMALLPPSSRMHLPSREATISAARRPTLVEPVIDRSGTSAVVQQQLADRRAVADDQVEQALGQTVGL